jgi:hypothetical protein
MKTYYTFTVHINDHGGATCGNADTLEGAIQEAVASAIYCKAHNPGAPIQYELIECCAVCHNEGTVARPKFKRVRCPECKGKCPTAKIGPISLKMPSEHNNIKLVVG